MISAASVMPAGDANPTAQARASLTGRPASGGLAAMNHFLAGLLGALAITAPAAAEPDISRMGAAELTAFMHAFPKGGELHHHLGGGTPAEDLLAWAVEDGACIDVAELAIRL